MTNMAKKINLLLILLLHLSIVAQAQVGSEIVGQVIQGIERQYYDTAYNQRDWEKIKLDVFLLNEMMPLTAIDLVDTLLLRLGDPAVRVLTVQEFELLNEELTAKTYTGIGLSELLSVDIEPTTGEVVVIAPLPDSPAERAGVRPNDVIVAVNGRLVKGLFLEDVTALLRPKQGRRVRLTIRRKAEILNLKLKTTTVRQGLSPYFKVVMHGDKKIGCVWFPQFTNASVPQFQDILQQFKTANIDGLLLDLRNNTGGQVPEVQSIAGFFMGGKILGRTASKSNYLSVLPALGETILSVQMVVLTNEGTANAAELLAGALQYHGRATIIGEQTHGKGLMHTFIPLTDGYVLSLPVARIALLNGRDIMTQGITPDVLVANDLPFRFGRMASDKQFLAGLNFF
jgi:carboxyl-terminal processing protease